MNKLYSVVTGTGCYIPERVVANKDFLSNLFYDSTGEVIDTPNDVVTRKFEEITTISERRYAEDNQVTSDLALIAAERAIEASGIDKEELDYIIFSHNFGETRVENRRIDVVPALASRLKYKLGILNPNAVAYDTLFGCPGWVQAMVQADYYIRSGDAKKILVVGADVLSRIADPHDRDSMIYADGAGAVILEARESETPIGILCHSTRSDTLQYAHLLHMGTTYDNNSDFKDELFLKMNGRKLYMYALENVPLAIKSSLDKINLNIKDISQILIHQANGKMDHAILSRLYKLYKEPEPKSIMPMTISWLGNSSVATVPTLLDMIVRGEISEYSVKSGDNIILASVGAGMNINSIVYRFP